MVQNWATRCCGAGGLLVCVLVAGSAVSSLPATSRAVQGEGTYLPGRSCQKSKTCVTEARRYVQLYFYTKLCHTFEWGHGFQGSAGVLDLPLLCHNYSMRTFAATSGMEGLYVCRDVIAWLPHFNLRSQPIWLPHFNWLLQSIPYSVFLTWHQHKTHA